MASKVPSGLKAPSKIGKLSGLPAPRGSGLPTPSSSRAQTSVAPPGVIPLIIITGALEKSARAAGLPTKVAETYAADMVKHLPGPEVEPRPPVPVDDYIIGDRVWVGGTKPGQIAFIGETQFAPGEWAGIVLDDPVGKNDGSVAGVRYFQCEMKRGVFARLAKLAKDRNDKDRTPPSSELQHQHRATDGVGVVTPPKTTANGGTVLPPSATKHSSVTTSKSGLVKKPVSGSATNLNKSSSRTGSMADLTPMSEPVRYPLSYGDRVLVSGSKSGILRYIGETDFAKGDWAGIELDDPLGKNDGAVAGKRYFSCKPLYGLFAPVHKVTRCGMTSSAIAASLGVTPSPRRGSVPKYGLGMPLSRERSGSQDSISSISSNTSSVSRSRVRLGVTSLSNQSAVASHIHRMKGPTTPAPQTSGAKTTRPTTLNLSATNTALQKVLKEKEEHIEQLLRERDMERSDLARAASQVDEAESMLMTLKTEHQRYLEESEEQMKRLRVQLDDTIQQKTNVKTQLEEERRKVEDMQFTIEEEAINKGDLESLTATEHAKLTELQDWLTTEKARTSKLEKDLQTWKQCYTEEKARFKEAEDSSIVHLDRVEELTHKLTMAESKLKSLEEAKAQQGSKVSEASEALTAKSAQIAELEEALHTATEKAKIHEQRITDLDEQLQSGDSRQKKQQETGDELMRKLAASDTASHTLSTEVQQLKLQLADLQRQLTASDEKTSNLEDDKTKLEEQIGELMAHSGDSSQHLSLMSEQLREKERKLEELQAALSDSTQKIGKLNETIEIKASEAERELGIVLSKHSEDLASFEERLNDKQSELEKSQEKLTSVKDTSEQEKAELEKKKELEIAELRSQIEKRTSEIDLLKTESESGKETITQQQTEQSNLKFEKEKLEKNLKKLESEKEKTVAERDSAIAEKDRLVQEQQSALSEMGEEQQRIKKLIEEKEELVKSKSKLEEKLEKLQKSSEESHKELETLTTEKAQTEAAIAEASVKVSALEAASLKVEGLWDANEKLRYLKEELEHYKQEEKSKQAAVLAEHDKLRKEKESVEKMALERDGTIHDLKVALEKTKAELVSMQAKLVKSEEQENSNKELQQKMLETQQQANEFESRLKMVEMEREALKIQVVKLKEVQQEKQALEENQATLRKEMDSVKQREKRKEDDFKIERKSLQNTLDTMQLLQQQKERDMEQLQNEMTVLQGENSLLRSQATSLSTVEQEKQLLEQQVRKLERSLAESQANANILTNIDTKGDPVLTKLKMEKETADGQIEFLNSVIVDMQRKNEELTLRLRAMEAGDVMNGAHDDSYISTPRKTAPRLFCDICDMFDVHDTDDCPTQAMSESPPATSYHGERNQERPYCTICEMFGHWTQDCDDEQTF